MSFRAAFVGDHQMGIHGVEPALDAFDRSVERLQIDGDIGSLAHAPVVPPFLFSGSIIYESGAF